MSWPGVCVVTGPFWLSFSCWGLSILSQPALKIIIRPLDFPDLTTCPPTSCKLFFPDKVSISSVLIYTTEVIFETVVTTAKPSSHHLPWQFSWLFFSNLSLRYFQRWKINSKFFSLHDIVHGILQLSTLFSINLTFWITEKFFQHNILFLLFIIISATTIFKNMKNTNDSFISTA